MKVLAIAGFARVGKDLLASMVKQKLSERGANAAIISLAESLKRDVCNAFGITLEELERDKQQYRPLLVAYGLQRRVTDINYFVRRWARKVCETCSDFDYVIVPDLRYANNKKDELFYFLNIGATVVTVEKFSLDERLNLCYTLPANTEEMLNFNVIKLLAHESVVWPDFRAVTEDRERFSLALRMMEWFAPIYKGDNPESYLSGVFRRLFTASNEVSKSDIVNNLVGGKL